MESWSVRLTFPDEEAGSEENQRYEWQPNFTLPEGFAFEPVFWRRGENAMDHGRGWGGVTRENSLLVKWSDLDVAPDVYYWGILLVRPESEGQKYERIKQLGGERSFHLWDWRNTAANPKLGTGKPEDRQK